MDGGLVQARSEPGLQLEPALSPESPAYCLVLIGRQVAEPAGNREGVLHQLIHEVPVGRGELRWVVPVDDVDLLGALFCEQGGPLEGALAPAYDQAAFPRRWSNRTRWQVCDQRSGDRHRSTHSGTTVKWDMPGAATTVSAVTCRPLSSVASKCPFGLERSRTRSGSTAMPAFSWNHWAYSRNSLTGIGSTSVGLTPRSSR